MDVELQLTLLGKPRICLDGAPLPRLARKKSLALLAYLAVTGRAHSREALAGLLWGNSTEANARASLRKVLADLRRYLAPYLRITRNAVAFDRACSHWLDVQVLERRVHQALGPHTVPQTEEAAVALLEAVELYRGGFLAGFHVRGALPFEEWVRAEGERLRLLVLRALSGLVDYYLAAGSPYLALAHAHRLLALEPCHEQAHRQLMRALFDSGQRDAALRQYQACRRVLAEDLGVEPSEATTELYKRLRTVPEASASVPAQQHNLPVPLTRLIGREEELAQIAESLRDPACRLLCLLGPGGSGKTHLALEAARAAIGTFAHGVWFVSLASLSSPGQVAPAITEALGLLHQSGTEPRRQLLNFARPKRLLLVLDNVEHLLVPPAIPSQDALSLLTDLLQQSPGAKILLTSRVRPPLQVAHLLPLGGLRLPCPVPGPGEHPSDSAAVQLFISAARRIKPDFVGTSDELVDVVGVCRIARGIPLAILLAASWISMLTPAGIMAELSGDGQQGLDLLEADYRDLPERQRSMRVVFDHSWDLLGDREREVFAALSVFRGRFRLEAARNVAGATLRELMALVDRSLLQRTSSGRYEMHDLLRRFAQQQLDQFPDAAGDTIRDRHSAFYTAALEAWWVELQGPRQHEVLDEIGRDSRDARAAWDWAADRRQVASLRRAVDGLCAFHKWRGRYREGVEVCSRAVQGLSAPGAPDLPGSFRLPSSPTSALAAERARLLSRLLAWQGTFHWQMGQAELADHRLREAQRPWEGHALEARDAWPEVAFALWRQGKMMFDLNRTRAGPCLATSLELFRALGDRWGVANVLEDLAWLARYQGRFEEARQMGEESLICRQALGDQRGISRSLRQLSTIAYRQGRLEEAESQIRESSALAMAWSKGADLADTFSSSGWILTMLGHYGEGEARLGQSVAIWKDLGVKRMVDYIGAPWAFATLHRDPDASVRPRIRAGLNASRRSGDLSRTAFNLRLLGWAELAQGAFTEAQAALNACIALYEELGDRDQAGEALALSAYAARGLGQHARARCHVGEALQLAFSMQVFLPAVLALPALALLLADEGMPGPAVEAYALASRYRLVADSRWFGEVAGGTVSLAAGSLSPDSLTALKSVGRDGDLWDAVAMSLPELEWPSGLTAQGRPLLQQYPDAVEYALPPARNL